MAQVIHRLHGKVTDKGREAGTFAQVITSYFNDDPTAYVLDAGVQSFVIALSDGSTVEIFRNMRAVLV